MDTVDDEILGQKQGRRIKRGRKGIASTIFHPPLAEVRSKYMPESHLPTQGTLLNYAQPPTERNKTETACTGDYCTLEYLGFVSRPMDFTFLTYF